MLTVVFGSFRGDSQLRGHEGTLGSQNSMSWIRTRDFSSSFLLLQAVTNISAELQGM